ncbi:unnamed protein product, partial [Notodromas monacha]
MNCTNVTKELSGSTIKIIYTQTPPSQASDAVFLEFSLTNVSNPRPNIYILLMVGKKPTPIFGQFQSFVSIEDMKIEADGIMSATLTAKSVGSIDKSALNDPKKAIYIGVLQLKSEHSMEKIVNLTTFENLEKYLEPRISSDYCMRTTSGGGSYFDPKNATWSNSGIKVKTMDAEGMILQTTHLSTFGAGFFVMPNTVDFSYVFANAGFADNLTIYLTLIVTIVAYIVILFWAIRKDKQDIEQLGALSLPDNKSQDKYLYEIMVLTGDQNSAMTDSKVSFIVSGEDDETDARTFGKPSGSKRRFFKKGQMDSFVMSCPRLRNVLSSSAMIGSLWRKEMALLIPVAGSEQKKEFKYLFNTAKSNNLRDGHLWFSIFLRPPRSRFTRAQRVSCCMALLYLTMLTNAMWYGTTKEKPGSGTLKFGPFALGIEQIGVGLMANFVVLIPSMLIITLFKKSRPRKLRKSRINEALKAHGSLDETKPQQSQ